MFPNSANKQLYFPKAKDNYKQKQCDTLLVRMIMEIKIVIDYYGGCHGSGGKSLCFAILTSNEECHLSRSTTCFGANVYICYDYVHLDIFSDINAY